MNHLTVNVWELQARLILCQLGAFSGSATMERSSYEAFSKVILVGLILGQATTLFLLNGAEWSNPENAASEPSSPESPPGFVGPLDTSGDYYPVNSAAKPRNLSGGWADQIYLGAYATELSCPQSSLPTIQRTFSFSQPLKKTYPYRSRRLTGLRLQRRGEHHLSSFILLSLLDVPSYVTRIFRVSSVLLVF